MQATENIFKKSQIDHETIVKMLNRRWWSQVDRWREGGSGKDTWLLGGVKKGGGVLIVSRRLFRSVWWDAWNGWMEGRRVKKRPFHHGSTTSLLLTLHHLSATPPLPPTHRKIKHTQSERTGLRWGNRGGAQSHLCYSAHAAAEAPVTWSRDPCPKQIWSRSSGVKLIKYIITNETNKNN